MVKTNVLSQHLRIIAVLVAKDFDDLFKNRGLLSTVGTVAFLMVMFQIMPWLDRATGPLVLAVFDPSQSSIVRQVEERDKIHLISFDSREGMERYIGKEGSPTLGIIVTPDFDHKVAGEGELQLDAIVDHWVNDTSTAELQAFVETELSTLVGRPVRLFVQRDTVYTHSEGWKPFLSSFALIVLLTMLGLMVTPVLMLEEKDARTINALLVSPASPAQIVLGKAITGLLLCLTGAAVWLAFNAYLVIHWGILILAVILGALFSVALGLVLGTALELKQQIQLWSFILAQPLLLGPVLAWLGFIPRAIRNGLLWIPTSALARTLQICFVADAPLSVVGRGLALLVVVTALALAGVIALMRRSDR